MASRPGHAGRINEDFVGATSGLAVLLDGAGIPNTEAICVHGVAWYASILGSTMLSCWARREAADLRAVLARAIEEVAGRHRSTCDIANPSSPQATVAMVAVQDQTLHYLALADAFVVLGTRGTDPVVVTDGREVEVRRESLAPLNGLAAGTPEYRRMRAMVIEELRGRRNQASGYWIAKDDLAAAAEAVTGSVPLDEVDSFALLSNGASRVVDPYDLLDWRACMQVLHSTGPQALLRRLRQHEEGRPDGPPVDDASVIFADFRRPPRGQLPGPDATF